MSNKPKVMFYWCSSCGGCEETIVDLEEKVLDVANAVDIVFWPCALDFKYSDVEKMADKEVTISFINGAIRTSEQEHIAKLIRAKSQLVVAFGSCAALGGIPALANLTSKEQIFESSYLNSPTVVNTEKIVPKTKTQVGKYTLEIPEFYDTVYKLDDVIDVDYYLPGCPPTSEILFNSVITVLEGKLPEKGSSLLSNKSLCTSCNRNKTKPEELKINNLKRIHEIIADPEKCFLEQGVICMGPATADGCKAPCVEGNMPCTGCFGPVSGVDQGANIIGSLGGIVQTSEEEVEKIAKSIPDPAGTFYKYSLSASYLGSKNRKQ